MPHSTLFLSEIVRADTNAADWPTLSGAGSGLSLVGHALLKPGGVRQREYRLKPCGPATEQIVSYLIYAIVTC